MHTLYAQILQVLENYQNLILTIFICVKLNQLKVKMVVSNQNALSLSYHTFLSGKNLSDFHLLNYIIFPICITLMPKSLFKMFFFLFTFFIVNSLIKYSKSYQNEIAFGYNVYT